MHYFKIFILVFLFLGTLAGTITLIVLGTSAPTNPSISVVATTTAQTNAPTQRPTFRPTTRTPVAPPPPPPTKQPSTLRPTLTPTSIPSQHPSLAPVYLARAVTEDETGGVAGPVIGALLAFAGIAGLALFANTSKGREMRKKWLGSTKKDDEHSVPFYQVTNRNTGESQVVMGAEDLTRVMGREQANHYLSTGLNPPGWAIQLEQQTSINRFVFQ